MATEQNKDLARGDLSKIGLLVPCCIDQMMPQTAFNAIALLEKMGLRTFYPEEFTCCGMDLYQQGDNDGAKKLGQRLIEQYEDCSHIVSLSSACVVYMQKQFPRLFHNTTLHNNYRQLVNHCYDFSDFLVNVLHVDDADSEYRLYDIEFNHKVTILDHCTTLRDYQCLSHPDMAGLREEPRRLLRCVRGLELVEMPQQDVCCGMGGLFASQFTAISNSLTRRKVDNAMTVGAEYIVSTEMRCLLNIRSLCEKNKLPVKCIHLADDLTSSI